MNLARLLERAARADGARAAVIHGTTVTATYRTLARDAAALGRGLRRDHDLTPGDRVAIVMKNCPAYVTALFGCWWAGLAAVPINAKVHAKELQFMLQDSGAKVALVSPALVGTVGSTDAVASDATRIVEVGTPEWRRLLAADPLASPLPCDGHEMAWLFYTSGTTGRPKGAMLSHANLMAMTACYFMDVDAVTRDACILHAAPMSHGSGMYILPHVCASAAQVIPDSGGFDPAEVFALIAAHPRISMFAAPTMVHRLNLAAASLDPDPTHLGTLVYGGGPMYLADCKEAMRIYGPKLAQIYGQGESPMTITALSKARHVDDGDGRLDERLASVGVPHSMVQVRVVDPQGNPVPTGEAGEVVVRGPTVMRGYWQRPDATAQALRDGWLWTGDLGAMDDEGYLTLKGRSKDMIISGGSNIYPREVEEALLLHPAVAEVAVTGRPHRDWGEQVVAFVVRRAQSAVDVDDLDLHCRQHIAAFKRPRHYHFVDELPKNNYGKVLKTTLREWLTPAAGDEEGDDA